jgi:hypothetical protein
MHSLVFASFMVSLSAVPVPTDPLSQDQLKDFLLNLYAPIIDVEFQYEGAIQQLQNPDYSKLPKELRDANAANVGKKNSYSYQGTYAYRSDGAFHLDLYRRPDDASQPVTREIHSLLDDTRGFRKLIPDKGGLVGPDVINKSHALSFIKEAFPTLVFSQPIIHQLLRAKSSSLDYSHAGWERKNGRNCLILEFFGVEQKTGQKMFSHKYWLDLERSGQPIYSEKYDGGSLAVRVSEIELDLYQTDDGQTAWHPSKGRFQSFRNLFDYSSTPVAEQNFDVLRGTLRINQKLANSRFSLDYGLDDSTRASIRKAANVASNRLRVSKKENSGERIRKALEEADKQAAPILVTAPSWLGRNAFPLMLAGLGLVGLVTATILSKRSG